jgi:outer membrane protein OmpA-like peptidoglycan-associated protein
MVKKLFLLLLLFIAVSPLMAQKRLFIVYYDSDSSVIQNSSKSIMDSAITAILSPKTISVHLFGYCDSDADSLYNIELSQKRINNVYNSLIQAGVRKEIITVKTGFGENEPVNTNSNAEQKQLNRRVDIFIFQQGEIKTEQIFVFNEEIEIPETEQKDTVLPGAFLKLLEEAEVGEKLVIPNIEFYPGRHKLMPYSDSSLNELLQVLLNNPEMEILLVGHVCCGQSIDNIFSRKDDGYDMDNGTYDLSVTRALEVYNYLVNNGVDPDRLTYEGRGNRDKLIKPELTTEDQQRNRRVEVVVVNK